MAKSRNFYSTVQLVTAPATPNTQFTFAHELGTIPRGAMVLQSSSPSGILYTAGQSGLSLAGNFIGGWEFEVNGALGTDSGPNGLTLSNTSVTQAVGQVGSSSAYVAASNSTLSRASEALLQAGDISFTFSAWVYVTSKTTFRILISKDRNTAPAGAREYELQYNSTTDRYQWIVWKPVDSGISVTANFYGSPPINTWTFIVCWHDAVADTMHIQVNNGLVDTVATGGALQAASNALFKLSGRENATPFAHEGRLDQVMFWKRVLSPTERAALYNSGSGVTVATALASIAPVDWTATDAYLKSSVGGAQYYVLFFA